MLERRKYQASITVFLAMVFLMVVSVVLVTLESARVTAVKSCMELSLTTSLDSIMAGYYRPMFEEYQIFGRYQKEKTDAGKCEAIQNELLERLAVAENPAYGLSELSGELHTAIKPEIQGIDSIRLKYMTDEDGAEFYRQACDAAKFYGLQKLGDDILDKLSLLSDSSKAGKIFAMQTEVEKKLAELDEVTLSLMRIVDGIQVKGGNIFCTGSYVKQPVTFPISKDSVKINHSLVYEAAKPYYIDKDELYSANIATLNDILASMDQSEILKNEIESFTQEQSGLQDQYSSICEQNQSLLQSISDLESEISELSGKKEDHAAEIAALEAQITSLQASIEANDDDLNQINARLEEVSENISKRLEEVNQLESSAAEQFQILCAQEQTIDECLGECCMSVRDAIDLVNKGIAKQEAARSAVVSYESDFEKIEGELLDPLKDPMKEELGRMKKYVGLKDSEEGGCSYDFEAIRAVLEKNLEILENLTYPAFQGMTYERTELQRIKTELTENQQKLRQYSIQGLEFDYSELQIGTSAGESAVDEVKKMIGSKLLDLVLEDSSKVSDKKIETASLPSTLAGAYHVPWSAGGKASALSILNQNVLTDLMEYFGVLFNEDGTRQFAEEMLNMVLFQAYIDTYFKAYVKEEDSLVETVSYPSVLEYEKEYMCFKQDSDSENLQEMVESMFLIRFGVSMLELYTNTQCVEKAQLTAAALTAFTGLGFLVTLTKMLILTAWAMVEAWIDVAAIMKGKKIEVFNNRSQHMSYEELLTVNKQVIMRKADNCREGHLNMGYKEYLFLFLLLQSKAGKCYTALDLIQANLDYRYEGGFAVTDCITGVEADLTYEIHPMYAAAAGFTQEIQVSRKAAVGY